MSARPVGVQDQAEFLQEIQALDGRLTQVEVIRYPLPFTLRGELERYESRIFSDAWDIPNNVFAESVNELRTWVESELGDLDQQRENEVRFVIDVVRYEG